MKKGFSCPPSKGFSGSAGRFAQGGKVCAPAKPAGPTKMPAPKGFKAGGKVKGC